MDPLPRARPDIGRGAGHGDAGHVGLVRAGHLVSLPAQRGEWAGDDRSSAGGGVMDKHVSVPGARRARPVPRACAEQRYKARA